MHVDVFVKSYNRPACLKQVLEALEQQTPCGLTVNNLTILQDGPKSAQDHNAVSECVSIAKRYAPKGKLILANQNLNANGNCERLWQAIIASKADGILTFEDDLLPGPLYFCAMEKLFQLAAKNPVVGMVSAHGMLGHSKDTQDKYARQLMPMAYLWGVHRWGWGATKLTAEKLAPHIFSYFDYCRSINYPGDNVNLQAFRETAKHWFYSQGFYQDESMIGYDASYDMAAFLEGMVHINTFASYATSIGRDGTSFSEETFKNYRYHLTELAQTVPDQFCDFNSGQLVKLLRLINHFHKSWNLYYQRGDEYAPMTKPQTIEAFYAHVLERPMTEEDIIGHRIHHLVSEPKEILTYPKSW